MRERYPAAALVILADLKATGEPDPKAAEAAQAVGGRLAVPDFGSDRPEGATDFNDLAAAQGPEAVRVQIEAAATVPDEKAEIWLAPEPIDATEWQTARLAPDCIVENYLYADAAVKIAPGGTGKTTLELFEAVHIALGRPLYGLEIRRPGPVVILTAEDSREMLVARLRRIAEALALTPAEIEHIQRQIRIADLCGAGVRLTEIINDVVRPGAFVDALAEGLGDLAPVLVTIDPAVSFGVGEARVNDAEQGLIEAARRLRRALNSCVRYIHHSGKQNARERTTDQYTGRGGSAFADGARMVHVLQPLDPSAWHKATGTDLEPGDNGLILARPKMSYCAPQGDILLRRRGYLFEHVEPVAADPLAALRRDADRVLAIIPTLSYPTQNMLAAADTGLSRDRTREVVRYLIDAGLVEYRKSTKRGGAQQYLHILNTADNPHTYRTPTDSAEGERTPENDPSCAAAYREEKARAPTRGLSPCDPKVSGQHTRAPTAHLAHLDPETWEADL
jgi:RecA-family ATPase